MNPERIQSVAACRVGTKSTTAGVVVSSLFATPLPRCLRVCAYRVVRLSDCGWAALPRHDAEYRQIRLSDRPGATRVDPAESGGRARQRAPRPPREPDCQATLDVFPEPVLQNSRACVHALRQSLTTWRTRAICGPAGDLFRWDRNAGRRRRARAGPPATRCGYSAAVRSSAFPSVDASCNTTSRVPTGTMGVPSGRSFGNFARYSTQNWPMYG